MTQNYNLPYTGEEVTNILKNCDDVLHAQPVNVLTLGVDNTGVIGISDIINAATVNYALYFPVGKYLIDKPLEIKNPIIGESVCNNFTDASKSTIFINGIQNESENDLIKNIGANNSIRNICIDGRNILKSTATELKSLILDEGTGRTKFDNINVAYVGTGCGINISHDVSVAADFENINIFSDDPLSENAGIIINAGTDLRMNNVIINGCQQGIVLQNGGYLYGNNIHIYCGVYEQRGARILGITKNNNSNYYNQLRNFIESTYTPWWLKTKGVVGNRSNFQFTNLYLDTTHDMFYSEQATLFSVYNLFSWTDDFINSNYMLKDGNGDLVDPSYPTTGSLIAYAEGSAKGKLNINGGSILAYKCHANLFTYLASGEEISSINNLIIYTPNGSSATENYYKNVLPVPVYGYSNKYKLKMPHTTNYIEIGRILRNYGKQCITIIDADNKKCYLTADTHAGTVTRSGESIQYSYYYKVLEDYIIIYTEEPSTNGRTIWCETTERCVNYEFLTQLNNTYFTRHIIYSNETAPEEIPYDMNILCLGDSIFASDGDIVRYLKEMLGANVVNGAVGGTRVTVRSIDDKNSYLRSDDGINKINSLTEELPKFDLVTINWGVNDYVDSVKEVDIITAYREILNYLSENHPTLRVLLITPIWCYFPSQNEDSDTYNPSGDCTLKDIATAIEKFAKEYKVSVLNAYQEMPLNENTAGTYFDEGDSIHLNSDGNRVFARLIAGKIKSMYGI